MAIQHHTNGEVTINGKRIGWADTYMQARTKNPATFLRIEAPHDAFVFWPMTGDGVRGEHVVINERLYDDSAKLNVAALARLA